MASPSTYPVSQWVIEQDFHQNTTMPVPFLAIIIVKISISMVFNIWLWSVVIVIIAIVPIVVIVIIVIIIIAIIVIVIIIMKISDDFRSRPPWWAGTGGALGKHLQSLKLTYSYKNWSAHHHQGHQGQQGHQHQHHHESYHCHHQQHKAKSLKLTYSFKNLVIIIFKIIIWWWKHNVRRNLTDTCLRIAKISPNNRSRSLILYPLWRCTVHQLYVRQSAVRKRKQKSEGADVLLYLDWGFAWGHPNREPRENPDSQKQTTSIANFHRWKFPENSSVLEQGFPLVMPEPWNKRCSKCDLILTVQLGAWLSEIPKHFLSPNLSKNIQLLISLHYWLSRHDYICTKLVFWSMSFWIFGNILFCMLM